jgi:hypothetical protein
MNNTNKKAKRIEELKKAVNLEIKFRKDEIKVMQHYSNIILNLEESDLVSFLNRQIEPFEILDKKWQMQTKETICNNLFLQQLAKSIDSARFEKVEGIEFVAEKAFVQVVERIRDEIGEL